MATNNFLAFCPTDTGTNLLSQSDYAAASDRTDGNQPGVASSKLNNKALRQSSYVVSQLAQFLGDRTGANILDDNTPARLLAQINAAMKFIAPVVTVYNSGSGTHNLTYCFFIATGSATVGATYTNNAVTFTVVATVASGVFIQMTGGGDPTVSGTLTKASGTGDATLTFYAMRAPLVLEVEMVGAGGGGAGSGAGAGSGGAGSDTTFGTAFLTCTTGDGGSTSGVGGAGGSATISGATGIAVKGAGGCATGIAGSPGGNGGSSAFGGGGRGAAGNAAGAGESAGTNSGAGGGGAAANAASGAGGAGAGGYIKVRFTPSAAPYAYAVSAGGAAGAGANAGGAGGAGKIAVTESYQ